MSRQCKDCIFWTPAGQPVRGFRVGDCLTMGGLTMGDGVISKEMESDQIGLDVITIMGYDGGAKILFGEDFGCFHFKKRRHCKYEECKSPNLGVRQKGPHKELFCRTCGKYQKFLNSHERSILVPRLIVQSVTDPIERRK